MRHAQPLSICVLNRYRSHSLLTRATRDSRCSRNCFTAQPLPSQFSVRHVQPLSIGVFKRYRSHWLLARATRDSYCSRNCFTAQPFLLN